MRDELKVQPEGPYKTVLQQTQTVSQLPLGGEDLSDIDGDESLNP